MSIATKRGDDGNTGLFGGRRVPKDHVRVEAYGAVDELNSLLGVVRSRELPPELDSMLARIQSELFSLGAELATPREENPHEKKVPLFPASALEHVEQDLFFLEGRVAPLTAFILPGGHPQAARLQVCRASCRRAERRVVAVARNERLPGVVLSYLNRLSDLLFIMARHINTCHAIAEPLWEKGS